MHLPLEDYVKVLQTMPIVCVDCLVRDDEGRYLLVERSNEPLKGEYWVPGGRVYKGERLADAVLRKMREEIGVDVDIIDNVGFFEEFYEKTAEAPEVGVHSISFVFVVKLKDANIKLDRQSRSWGWFPNLPAGLLQYGTIQFPQA